MRCRKRVWQTVTRPHKDRSTQGVQRKEVFKELLTSEWAVSFVPEGWADRGWRWCLPGNSLSPCGSLCVATALSLNPPDGPTVAAQGFSQSHPAFDKGLECATWHVVGSGHCLPHLSFLHPPDHMSLTNSPPETEQGNVSQAASFPPLWPSVTPCWLPSLLLPHARPTVPRPPFFPSWQIHSSSECSHWDTAPAASMLRLIL